MRLQLSMKKRFYSYFPYNFLTPLLKASFVVYEFGNIVFKIKYTTCSVEGKMKLTDFGPAKKNIRQFGFRMTSFYSK